MLIPRLNKAAACRRDRPPSTAVTTRTRKSSEYGFAIPAGPLPLVASLNHDLPRLGNPKSDSIRSDDALDGPPIRVAGDWASCLTATLTVLVVFSKSTTLGRRHESEPNSFSNSIQRVCDIAACNAG